MFIAIKLGAVQRDNIVSCPPTKIMATSLSPSLQNANSRTAHVFDSFARAAVTTLGWLHGWFWGGAGARGAPVQPPKIARPPICFTWIDYEGLLTLIQCSGVDTISPRPPRGAATLRTTGHISQATDRQTNRRTKRKLPFASGELKKMGPGYPWNFRLKSPWLSPWVAKGSSTLSISAHQCLMSEHRAESSIRQQPSYGHTTLRSRALVSTVFAARCYA